MKMKNLITHANFHKCDRLTIGMMIDRIDFHEAFFKVREDGANSEYRSHLGDEENDPLDRDYVTNGCAYQGLTASLAEAIKEYMPTAVRIAAVMNEFLIGNAYDVNPLAKYGFEFIRVIVERGFLNGFRLVATPAYLPPVRLDILYEYLQPHEQYRGAPRTCELPIGMTLDEFEEAIKTPFDFCEYVFEQLTHITTFRLIEGMDDWTSPDIVDEGGEQSCHALKNYFLDRRYRREKFADAYTGLLKVLEDRDLVIKRKEEEPTTPAVPALPERKTFTRDEVVALMEEDKED